MLIINSYAKKKNKKSFHVKIISVKKNNFEINCDNSLTC